MERPSLRSILKNGSELTSSDCGSPKARRNSDVIPVRSFERKADERRYSVPADLLFRDEVSERRHSSSDGILKKRSLEGASRRSSDDMEVQFHPIVAGSLPASSNAPSSASDVLHRLSQLDVSNSRHRRTRDGHAGKSRDPTRSEQPGAFKYQQALERVAKRVSLQRYGKFSQESISTAADSEHSDSDSVWTIKLSCPMDTPAKPNDNNCDKRERLTTLRQEPCFDLFQSEFAQLGLRVV